MTRTAAIRAATGRMSGWPGNPASKLGYSGGYDAADTNHTRILNNNLKGRAFWWLLARIAGWEGAGS